MLRRGRVGKPKKHRNRQRQQAMSTPSNSGIGTGPGWSLRLFGGFELRTSAGVPLPGKRERLLLAYLALTDARQIGRSPLGG